MKLVVEIEVEHTPESEDEREHFTVKEVIFEKEKVPVEFSMDRSSARYWSFFCDASGFTLSVIEDKG